MIYLVDDILGLGIIVVEKGTLFVFCVVSSGPFINGSTDYGHRVKEDGLCAYRCGNGVFASCISGVYFSAKLETAFSTFFLVSLTAS